MAINTISRLTILSLMLVISYSSRSYGSFSSSRPCVIENRIGKGKGLLAFSTSKPSGSGSAASVQVAYGDVTVSPAAWLPWQDLPLPGSFSPPISNVACDYTDTNQTQIYVQLSDGQVYTAKQDQVAYLKFSTWKGVGQNRLPTDGSQGSLLDSVFVGPYKNDVLVFARSKSSNNSQLYFCKGNSTGFGSWNLLGGSKAVLGTDATIIMNPFSGKYEAFMTSPEGIIHRTWQHNENSFADWRYMDYAPKLDINTRPVAGVMGYSMFNGKLLVAGLGQDGYVHRCEQATCDSLDNPWGYCTWGSWHQTGSALPFVSKAPNNVAVSRNVHFGTELFSVDDATGQLWQAWQLERDAAWHGWTKVPQDLPAAQFSTLPHFIVNRGGWWTAFAQSSSSQIVSVEPSRSMNATPSSVSWGANLTVSWSVAVDEVTRWDWVALYPSGANNDQYVDYRYVQGGLNPGRNPVQTGNVTMASYLPYGTYQARYLVNKKYISVVQQDVTYYNQSTESEIMQLYRGIFEGLGVKNAGIEQCVDEGAVTVEKFQQAFDAFEKGEIYDGLNLLGDALQDVAETLRRCEEVALAADLDKFVKDLVECTESDCTSFLVDLAVEVVILYMNEYEIYGDIKGASNSFNLLEAYQQGGLCIGRLVGACLTVVKSYSPVI